MRLRLIKVLAILAFSISATAVYVNANAAVKVGAKCKEVGQIKVKKNNEFTCISKGKKLVWSKGKTVKKDDPQVAPTPRPTKAQASFSFKYNIDESLPKDYAIKFRDTMKNLGEVIPIDPKIGENPEISKESGNPFMNIYVAREGANAWPDTVTRHGDNCLCGNGRETWMNLTLYNYDIESNNVSFLDGLVAHEDFHVYLMSLSKNVLRPKWLAEGTATLFSDLYENQYYGQWDLEWKIQNDSSKFVFPNPKLFEKFESSEEDSTGKAMDSNYGSSVFMVLVLVKELQKQGISEQRAFEMVFKDFWVENGQLPQFIELDGGNERNTVDWQKIFKSLFKMDVGTFYTRLQSEYSLADYKADYKKVLPSKSLKIQDIFVSK
ncbi:MAG: hypothetical protein QNL32_00105 [Actinomycetes bacterium]